MQLQNFDFWTTASNARDDLEEQLQDHDDVRFVDIGYPQDGGTANDDISLRIHVSDESSATAYNSFPAEVDGVPVTVSNKS